MTIRLVHQRTELRMASQGRGSDAIATVMTLGALHAGHAALIQRARAAVGPAGQVIVTVFVNPLQFSAGEDFARYPRTLEADLQIAEAAGADIVYAPEVSEIYGGEVQSSVFADAHVRVQPGRLGDVLEGASRPGHFAGVLTVVAILLHHTSCGFAPFGEKDYQQLILVRSMVRDLGFDVEILPVPTLREPDGLALSSRNRYLSEQERARALIIPRVLTAAREVQHRGAQKSLAAARAVLQSESGVEVDYLELRDPWLQPVAEMGASRLLIAARVGTTRLLDNIALDLGSQESRLDGDS
ncbi:MAG: pantoate--beta-alanine ligase [Actinomycetales bacterium]